MLELILLETQVQDSSTQKSGEWEIAIWKKLFNILFFSVMLST